MFCKKNLVVTVLCFCITTPVLAQNNYYDSQNRAENASVNYDDSVTDYPKVINFEKQIYNRSFQGQNIYNRVARIENTLFSQSFDNEELIDRVDRISEKLGTQNNQNSNSDVIEIYEDNNISSNLPMDDLNNLEQRTFGRSYSKDNPVVRIKRLENELLGAAQTGDINYRIERLKIATQSNGLDGFLDRTSFPSNGMDLGGGGVESFSGTSASGIIPSLIPYLRNLLNCNFDSNNNKWENYSYRHNYSNYGTAAGVHILK